MSSLLEIKNLTVTFNTEEGPLHAVNGISFSLNKSETVGIVGESGSGKSVTALSIMRLLSKEATITGDVIFNPTGNNAINLTGLPLKEMSSHRGKDIAMIFQEPMTSLNPVFSCGFQVAEALILHKKLSKHEAKEKTITLFEKVKLQRPEQMFDAFPHQISGGQKQRVMIAMAMSCNPSILIADEPTTALDVTVQANILELMRKLQEEYKTGMLFITHDLGVVSQIADRIIVLYKGKIVEKGTVSDIFSRPQHPYTKGLLACRPPLDKRLHFLPTVKDFMQENEDGTIVEIISSVNSVKNEISKAETKLNREKLYSNPPILEVKNLKVHFPIRKGVFGKVTHYVHAVDDVSFDVYPGETLGLVGESGCGKTTLGKAIIRLLEPASGKIIFKGKDFSSLTGSQLRKMRKHIQIIFQDPYSSLNPRITIGNAILEPMKVHGLFPGNRKQKVFELLERVNLKEEHYNRYPHEFSGGQRQRICIARALASEPEFIICDESVSALDVSIQAQILNLLNSLKKDFRFTSIFISHDLSVVKFMSDRMIVMNQGRIEEMGDPDTIYSYPASEYTRKLIKAIPGRKGEGILEGGITRRHRGTEGKGEAV
jgi:peptide/nickel transport system ATP-binding protein